MLHLTPLLMGLTIKPIRKQKYWPLRFIRISLYGFREIIPTNSHRVAVERVGVCVWAWEWEKRLQPTAESAEQVATLARITADGVELSRVAVSRVVTPEVQRQRTRGH